MQRVIQLINGMTKASRSDLVIPSLIVGLGNPGSKYERTRHNVGFAAVDALARHWQIGLSAQQKFQAEFGQGQRSSGQRVRLLKPLTYMNDSGRAIRAAVDWFNLPVSSVLVIYDDMDLPVGKIRLRLSGSAGGHNGIRSAIAHLGTQDFPRLRVGIGQPPAQADQRDTTSYVLGRLSAQEAEVLPAVLQGMIEAIEFSLTQGIEKAMSLYNGRILEGTTPH